MSQRTQGINASIDLHSPGTSQNNVILGKPSFPDIGRSHMTFFSLVANFHTHPPKSFDPSRWRSLPFTSRHGQRLLPRFTGNRTHRQLIAPGTIDGGIIFFAVFVFLLMSPVCSGLLFGCGKPNKAIKKTENDEDLQEKVVKNTTSWVSIPNPSKRASLETVKDTTIDIAPALVSFPLENHMAVVL